MNCNNKPKGTYKKNKPPKCACQKDCEYDSRLGCIQKNTKPQKNTKCAVNPKTNRCSKTGTKTPNKCEVGKTGKCKKKPQKSKKKKKEIILKKKMDQICAVNPNTNRCSKTGTETPELCEVSKTGNCKKSTVPTKEYLSGNSGSVVFTKSVLLAKPYVDAKGKQAINDPKDWWISEKFDGYRAIWDGAKFVSRNKKKSFSVPEWFSSIMPPNIPLDGELWVGRDKFDTCGLFRKKVAVSEEWIKNKVVYKVFDIPNHTGVFEERMNELQKIVKDRCKNMKLLNIPSKIKKCPLEFTKQTKCKSEAHLQKMLEDVLKKSGEGLMLRKPNSKYEFKRSNTLLKIKKLFDDECVIIGYKPGTGKYKGKLGSFKCELKKNPGVTFYVSGMNDEIRNNYKDTHPVGTVITFQYNELNTRTGVPRHPRYLRIRSDADL